MQKKLIALAIAGLSGAAFAQSNVSVYGVADMYYAHVSASGTASANVVNSGGLAGSRIGFKGVEALGNGTSALFVLEYGLSLDTNSGFGDNSARTAGVNSWGSSTAPGASYNTASNGTNNVARQQIVGLTGGWGTAVAGYAQTAGYDFACAVDPLAGGALDTTSRLPGQMLLNCGKGGRASNAVAYISPKFGGFNFAVNYAAGENPSKTASTSTTDKSADNAYLIGLNYANGPLDVRFVYSNAKINSDGLVNTGGVYSNALTNQQLYSGSSIKEMGLGGSYDFGVAKVFASYQTLDATAYAALNSTTDATPGKNKTWQLGVKAPVGPGALVASYAKVKMDEVNGNAALSLAGKNYDDKSYAIAYVYPMSKRTSLYGGMNKYNNGSDSTRQATVLTPSAGGSTTTWALGMNHSF